MRLRVVFIAALSCVLALLSAPTANASPDSSPSRGCQHCASGIPDGVPAVAALGAVSSTTVRAGGTVQLGASFVNVPYRPTLNLYYRSRSGVVTTVPFNIRDFTITVPAQWRPGRYTLIKVMTSAEGGSTQFRNHRLIGTILGEPNQTVCGRSPVNLRALDLRVVGPAAVAH